MKKVLVFASAVLLVACASYKPMVPAQSDADRATKENPQITLADLNEGKSIFEENCHKCHSLKKPFKKTDEEIADALPRMAKRAKLDSIQEAKVLNYLLTMNDATSAK